MEPASPSDLGRSNRIRRLGGTLVAAVVAIGVVGGLGTLGAFVHQAVRPDPARPPQPYQLVVSSSGCRTVGYVVERSYRGRPGRVGDPGSFQVMQKLPEAWLGGGHVYGSIVPFQGPPPARAVGIFVSGSRNVVVGQVRIAPNASCGHA